MAAGRSNHLGAYGLRLTGIAEAAPLLVPAPPEWTPLRVVRGVGNADSELERVDSRRARLRMRNGGLIELERNPACARFLSPAPPRAAEIVHPYLASVAAVMTFWQGRESFHAGGFVSENGVWALLGGRGAGKSSMLAGLASRGAGIACDDLLVLNGGTVLAGPRTLDLRAEAAEQLGVGVQTGTIGARERWRVGIPPIESELPLRGLVFLAWGEEMGVTTLSPSERLERLLHHRGVRLPSPDPSALLELARLPGFELRRPRHWESLSEATDLLLAAIGR